MQYEKPTQKQYATRNEYVNAWYKWMRVHHPEYKLLSKIYGSMATVVRSIKKETGADKYRSYIECTTSEFQQHIESQFKKNMSWDNYGIVWEFDHKDSLMDVYKAHGEQAMLSAARYRNIRPLAVKLNRAGKAGKRHTAKQNIVTHGNYHYLFVEEKRLKIDKRVANKLKDCAVYERKGSTRGHGFDVYHYPTKTRSSLLAIILGEGHMQYHRKPDTDVSDYRRSAFKLAIKRNPSTVWYAKKAFERKLIKEFKELTNGNSNG